MCFGIFFSQLGIAKLGIVARQQVGSPMIVERVLQQFKPFKLQSGAIGADGP